jgi:hypothetical protein
MLGSRSPDGHAPSKSDSGTTVRFQLSERRPKSTASDPASIAATLVVLATIAVVPISMAGRIAIGLVFVLFAMVIVLVRRSKHRPPKDEVAATRDGILRKREGEAATMLVRWTERFGVTLLSNRARDRALFAFTMPDATRYVRVDLSGAPANATRDFLAHATLALDADVLLGDDDASAKSLHARDALNLVRAIETRASGAFDRLYLSDAQGGTIDLDDAILRVGTRTFDLRAPLEWRGFMFHESTGTSMTVYQATLVRQAGVEVVLVATMAPELYLALSDVSLPTTEVARDWAMRRALARDLRLLHSAAEPPPARDLRVAIDRVFVLPLRHAIDRAPRAARVSTPPERSVPAGRAT